MDSKPPLESWVPYCRVKNKLEMAPPWTCYGGGKWADPSRPHHSTSATIFFTKRFREELTFSHNHNFNYTCIYEKTPFNKPIRISWRNQTQFFFRKIITWDQPNLSRGKNFKSGEMPSAGVLKRTTGPDDQPRGTDLNSALNGKQRGEPDVKIKL